MRIVDLMDLREGGPVLFALPDGVSIGVARMTGNSFSFDAYADMGALVGGDSAGACILQMEDPDELNRIARRLDELGDKAPNEAMAKELFDCAAAVDMANHSVR